MSGTEGSGVNDGDRIDTAEIAEAVTRAPFIYGDGATQVFRHDGRTIYTDEKSQSPGEWGVDEYGRFWSFWPPSYRASYEVSWITADDGEVVGIRFTGTDGAESFEGRYAPELAEP